MSVPKCEADSSIHSKVITGSQNFDIGSCDPGHAHLGGLLVIRTQEGSVFHLCTKFDADGSIGSKFTRGPKFSKFGHVTRPRPLRVDLWSVRRRDPSSISVPNLKRIASFVQKL